MPVDDEINLDSPDGITQENIDRMNEMADELEQIAERSETNAEKIKQNMKSVEKDTDDVKDVTDITSNNTGIEERLTQIEETQKKFITLFSKAKEEREENKRKLTEAEKERIKLMKKIKESEDKITEGYSNFTSMAKNPTGFAISTGKSSIKGLLGRAGVYGLVAMFAWEMGERIYNDILEQIKGMFKAGGLFDVRKESLDNMKQIPNLEHMISVHRGEVFFTSDTAEALRQGAPFNSNVREKVNGHKQYLQEFDR